MPRGISANRRICYGLLLLAGLILLWIHDGELGLVLKSDLGSGEALSQIGDRLGNGGTLALILIVLWVLGRIVGNRLFRQAAGRAFLGLVLSGLMTQIIKHLIGRPRPRLWVEGVSHFGPTMASGLDSFPSGHTATAVAVALILGYHFPKASPIFMGLAAFIAVARLIGGSHFPTDILGGVALGLICGWAVIVWSVRRSRRASSSEGRAL